MKLDEEFERYWETVKASPPYTPKEIARHAWEAAIRAADLSDLEPKEGATPRTGALLYPPPTTWTTQTLALAYLCKQLERELPALTARLEAAMSAMKTAHNFLQEHWSGNPDWKKGNEHLWIARADFELERGIEALDVALKERK